MRGADPEALHLAGFFIGIGGLRKVEGLEGDASGGSLVVEGEEDGAGGFGVGAGESGEFFFEGVDADVLMADGVVEEAGVFAHEGAAEGWVVAGGVECGGPEGRHRDRVQGERSWEQSVSSCQSPVASFQLPVSSCQWRVRRRASQGARYRVGASRRSGRT